MRIGLVALSLVVVVLTLTAPANAGVRDDYSTSPIIDSIAEQHATYSVAATAHADGILEVSIKREDGALLFESTYPVIDADGGKSLEWRYYYDDGTVVTRMNRIPGEIMPTIKTMSSAGKDIVRMLGDGLQPGSQNLKPGKIKTNDTWGCDLPEWADIECTSRGNCCDTHDACYYVGNCSYWSWLGVGSLWCETCNTVVALCITTGLGSMETPSVCCERGTCGTPYEPIVSTGDKDELVPMMYPSEGGAGTGTGVTVPGVVYTSDGKCKFPDGTVLPCG